MDFIDIESFQKDDTDTPASSVALPISPDIDTLSKKFTNFNNLTRKLLSLERKDEALVDQNTKKKVTSADAYANLSISFIEGLSRDENEEESGMNVSNVRSRSALSTRISDVINNPVEDSLIRGAFESMNLSVRDSEDLVDSGIVGSTARKKLRSKVENNLIRSQASLLKEFQPAVKALSAFQAPLHELTALKDDVSMKVDRNLTLTSPFKNQITGLNDEKKQIKLKRELLVAFRNKFALNVYEEYYLESGEINEEFFQILVKCENIHENCKALLTLDDPQLGIKIMAKFNKLIDRAIERVLNFTKRTLSNLYSLHTKSKLLTFQECLAYLRKRPEHLNKLLEDFVEIRSNYILKEFNNQINGNALASEDEKGSKVRPLYLTSHDPVRFVGDLLAYIHSSFVNEMETIRSIFTENLTRETETSYLENDCMAQDMAWGALKSLVRPVKSKIEQIVSSETKLSTVYSIYSLLDLYLIMFTKNYQTNGSKASFLAIMPELIDFTRNRFIILIQNRLATIKSSNMAQLDLNLDLQPPDWIMDFQSDVLPIVDKDGSVTFMKLPQRENSEFLKLVVDEPISIFYEHIKNSVTHLFSKQDKIILKLNFLDLTLSKILPLRIMVDKTLQLNDSVESLSIDLTDTLLDSLLEGSQLKNYYNIMNMICTLSDDFFEVSIYEPISENKFFNKDSIKEADNAIKKFLPTALIDTQQSLSKLNSPSIATKVITGSSIAFTKFYNKFRIVVQEYMNEDILSWTDKDVATLLGVEDEYSSE